MTPRGHRLTAAAMAVSGLLLFAGTNMVPAGLFAFGALFGARAPDWLEIAHWRHGERHSLIPHRTLTHWPWPWLAVGFLPWVLFPAGQWPLWLFALNGFALSGLLHLLFDIMTPAGIPLGLPFGRRYSLNWYRTGGAGEIVAVVLTWLVPFILVGGETFWSAV